jgi:hypothetical protein
VLLEFLKGELTAGVTSKDHFDYGSDLRIVTAMSTFQFTEGI